MQYKYRIATKNGEVREGAITAFSFKAAKRKLEQNGDTLIFALPNSPSIKHRELLQNFKRFTKNQQITFFRNLAAMIHSGISLSEALRVTEEQIRNPGMKKAITALIHDVENGVNLSAAMKKHQKYFSGFILETVHAGEVGGRLSKTLDQIANDLEREHELERDVKAHMAYPVIVFVVMTIVVGILSVYVLPKIANLFAELGIELPLITRILLNLGAFIGSHPTQISVVLAAIFGSSFYFVKKTYRGKYIFHYALLHAPIFGGIIRETTLAKFFHSLESLFASDISLVRSVGIAEKTLKNEVYKKALSESHPLLLHGVKLSDALKTRPDLFPLQARRMIEVGERAGNLDQSFTHVSNYFERSVRYRTKTLTAMVEPVLIVIAGILVGGIALSIFLPIYQKIPQAIV